MEDRESITFGHIWVFVVGGLVGAAVGLLFAPKSGREVRDDIKDRAGKLKNAMGENWQSVSTRGKEVLDNVATRSRDAYDKGTELVTEQKGRLGAALTAGSAAAKEAYRKETPAPPPDKT